MKLLYVLCIMTALADISAMELVEKERVLDKQAMPTKEDELHMVIEGNVCVFSMVHLWGHISRCIVKEKKNKPEKALVIHGFHYYEGLRCKPEDYKGGKLIKINDSVWIYSVEENIKSFHGGIVFCDGISASKTFFPAHWSKEQAIDCIVKAAVAASFYDKKTYDWGKEYTYEAPLEENVKLRFVICSDCNNAKMRLISAYPVLSKNKEVSDVILKEIAKMRLEGIILPRASQKTLPPASPEIQKLMNAAKKGDLEELILLQESGMHMTALDQLGNSALYYAVGSGEYLSTLFLINDKLINLANNDGVTPLVRALAARDVGIVGLLITYGADVKSGDCRNQTPLMHTVRIICDSPLDAATQARVLLKAGADPNMKDRRGTALMLALEYDKAEDLVHSLLDFDANYTTVKNDRGKSALEIEGIKGRRYIANWIKQKEEWKKNWHASEFQYLVQAGHRSHVQMQLNGTEKPSSDEINSALPCAAANEDEAMVELLLQAGADPGHIPQSFFANGAISKSLKEILKKRSKEIKAADKSELEKRGRQLKQAYDRFFDHFESESLDMQDLVDLIHFKDHLVTKKDKCTPFLFAVREGKSRIVEQLLKQGIVNTQAVDAYGRDALTIAYDNNDSKTFGLLLAHASLLDSKLNQMFEKVLQDGKKEFIVFFLYQCWNLVLTKFKAALRSKNTKCLELLKKYAPFSSGQAKYIAFDALTTEDVEFVKNFIKEYPEILDARNERGQSLLTAAAELNREDLVLAFDELGLGIEKSDDAGKSAFCYATGKVKTVIEEYGKKKKEKEQAQEKEMKKKELVASGWPLLAALAYFDEADAIDAYNDNNVSSAINKINPKGDTALHVAAKEGHSRAIRALCQRGASVNKLNACGSTALLVAFEKEHYEIAKQLLQAGALIFCSQDAEKLRYLENKKLPIELQKLLQEAYAK